MADTDTSEFKIRFDDERPETQLQGEVGNLRIGKLNRKINLFSIFIPCLVGIALVFGYLDIKNRFDTVHVTGTSEVQTLAKDLESKFSSLSVRQAKIEALLDKKISAIEKTAARLQRNVDKIEKALLGFRSSTPDKKELAGVLTGLDKTLAPIISDIKKISSEIVALDAKFAEESDKLTVGSRKIRRDINSLKESISALTSAKVDKKLFDLAVRHEEMFVKQKLQDLEKSLSGQIADIHNRIKALEVGQQKKADVKPASSENEKPATGPITVPSTPAQTAAPASEAIIEQEISK